MEQLRINAQADLAAIPVSHSIGRGAAAFIAIAFGISWSIWITARLLGAHVGVGEEILAFGTAGPAIAAILLLRNRQKALAAGIATRLVWFALLWAPAWAVYILSDKMRGVTPAPSLRFCLIVALLAAIPAWIGSGAIASDAGVWGLLRTLAIPRNWRWHAIAFFSLPVVLLVPAAIAHALGRPVVVPRATVSICPWIAYSTLMFLRALFFTAYFEEPGWRGYLLPLLQRRFSPLVATVLVAIPWSLWHAPLDYHGPVGVSLMNYLRVRVVSLFLVAILLTWLYNRSRGNIFTMAVFHAGMNTFPIVLPYTTASLGLVVLWVLYVIFSDKMWRRPKA